MLLTLVTLVCFIESSIGSSMLLTTRTARSTELQEKRLFNLKFAAKNLERIATKSTKEEEAEKNKLKIAIEKGNIEGARIHAENAIRQKNQCANYLRIASRVYVVCSRVETAISLKQVTSDMGSVVKGLDTALKSMDLEKVQLLMDEYEKQSEDMDVQSQAMEQSMSNTVTLSIPEDSIDSLIQEVADEYGLEVELRGQSVPSSSIGTTAEQDELSQRLAKLGQ